MHEMNPMPLRLRLRLCPLWPAPRKSALLVALVAALALGKADVAFAQKAEADAPKKEEAADPNEQSYTKVAVDLVGGIITDQRLPFDVPFYLHGDANPNVDRIQIIYGESKFFTSTLVQKFNAELKRNPTGEIMVEDLQDSLRNWNPAYEVDLRRSIRREPRQNPGKYIRISTWSRSMLANPHVRSTGTKAADEKAAESDQWYALIEPLRGNRSYTFLVIISLESDYVRETIIRELTVEFLDAVDELTPELRTAVAKDYQSHLKYTLKQAASEVKRDEKATPKPDPLMEAMTVRLNKHLDNMLIHDFDIARGAKALKNAEPITVKNLSEQIVESDIDNVHAKAFDQINTLYGTQANAVHNHMAAVQTTAFAQQAYRSASADWRKKNPAIATTIELIAQISADNTFLFGGQQAFELNHIHVLDDLRHRVDTTLVKAHFAHFAQLDTKLAALHAAIAALPGNAEEVQKFDPSWVTKDPKDSKKLLVTDQAKTDLALALSRVEALRAAVRDSKALLRNILLGFRQVNARAHDMFDHYFPSRKLGGLSALASSSVNEYKTRADYYISADLGMGYFNLLQATDRLSPYVAVNFQLAPYNKQAHYSLFRRSTWSSGYAFLKPWSVVVGVTLTGIYSDSPYHSSVLTWNNDGGAELGVLSGLGLRLNDHMRISGGVHYFKYRQSTLYENQNIRVGGYVGLSIDYDVREKLGPVLNRLFGGLSI